MSPARENTTLRTMNFLSLLRIALSMPPHLAVRKASVFAFRLLDQRVQSLLRRHRCSYVPVGVARLHPQLGGLDLSGVAAQAEPLRAVLPHYRAHRFDLLGSGWVLVAHGERYDGFGPHRYGPGPCLPQDWRAAVAAAHQPGNRVRARAILDLITDPAYVPIDWQVDFKSGYRWSSATWGRGIAYGHRPGIDVKVPWELARLQHLVHLAAGYALDQDADLAAEFRHQALDFLGGNPPGWGVNWACAMDVAIRGANLALAWDLFRAAGAVFDAAFEAELAAGLLAHGTYVRTHLEWSEHHRGNHYLADICGLAFIAATVGQEAWLSFANKELEAEIIRQFLPDGGNFEASTLYHRLSAEMVLSAAALLAGCGQPPLSEAARGRLDAALRFAADVTKPSGEMVQIGDTDSGRFFKLTPLFDLEGGDVRERHLDPRGLEAWAAGVLGEDRPVPPLLAWEKAIATTLAGRRRLSPPVPVVRGVGPQPVIMTPGARLHIIPSDPTALEGMRAIAYPDFGLFIWRGARAFISVRCGPVGQNGQGGHAHNDQLAVEIEIDGVSWVRDPGSYVYTPDLAARNRYRSVQAHFAPRRGVAEPARMLAPFRLEDRAQAEILRFGPDFVGRHRGYGEAVYRRVAVENGIIVVEDWPGSGMHAVHSPTELATMWGLNLPASLGYGLLAPTKKELGDEL
ncbi:conserved hypothetical protein [Candidatus Terasakiella magnetica]|nr:conserved hypothetical protein [Candidatus Terasakiella magnetica]